MSVFQFKPGDKVRQKRWPDKWAGVIVTAVGRERFLAIDWDGEEGNFDQYGEWVEA